VIETKIVFGYYSVTKNIETYIEDMEDKAKKKNEIKFVFGSDAQDCTIARVL
jgi:hypothetical protein